MKITTLSKLFFVSIVLTLTSCGGIIKSYVNKDPDNVPPDFGKVKFTMLILKGRSSYNKGVEENFKKYYKGDYIMVSDDELSTKYNDTEKYKYLFASTLSITRRTSISGSVISNNANSSGSLSFYVTDRKANKSYDAEISSGTSYKKIIKVYVIKLESVREKNEPR